jgi:hypothetical protein
VGELPGPPGAPRLLRYGMYDVQPAQEPDWTSPPFAAEVRDLPGVGPAVVARGSANSKSCLACFFLAVEVLRELDAMPLTVALMIEGEEELGSPNLADAVRARAGDLTAEGAFDLDLTAGLDGQPELILGCKGLCDLELVCEAGDWGGPPSTCTPASRPGSPRRCGPWSRPWPPSPAPTRRSGWPASTAGPGPGDGRPAAAGRAGRRVRPGRAPARGQRGPLPAAGGPAELLEALLFRPTMNISGHRRRLRRPRGQDDRAQPGRGQGRHPPGRAATPRRPRPPSAATWTTTGFGHVQVRLLDAYPWAKAPPGNRSEAAMRASYRALGRDALPYPLAPWCAPYFVFDRILGLPWASGGVGHAAGAHGPDEYATLAGLEEHIVGAAAFLLAYADLPR